MTDETKRISEQYEADKFAIYAALRWAYVGPLGVEKTRPSRHVKALLERLEKAERGALPPTATAAARVPGLEARVKELESQRDSLDKLWRSANDLATRNADEGLRLESERDAARRNADDWKVCAEREVALRETVEKERDAARQEAATWVRDIVEPVRKALGLDSTTTIPAAVERLTARVAELERELTATQAKFKGAADACLKLGTDLTAAEARATSAERELRDAHRALNEAGAPEVSEADEMPPGAVLPVGERVNRLRAPTPAPGLHEAMGKVCTWVRGLLSGLGAADAPAPMRLGQDGPTLTPEDLRALAAYDAAKGGEDPDAEKARKWDAARERFTQQMHEVTMAAPSRARSSIAKALWFVMDGRDHGPFDDDTPPSGPGGGERPDGRTSLEAGYVRSGQSLETSAPSESVVTHAQLAAVVETLRSEAPFDGYPVAQKALDEVLRRVTGGQTPEHPDTARLRTVQGLLTSAVADLTVGLTGATYQPGGEARLLAGLQALRGLSLGQVPEMLLKSRVVEVLTTPLGMSFCPTCGFADHSPGDDGATPFCNECEDECGSSDETSEEVQKEIARRLGLTPNPPAIPESSTPALATATHHGGPTAQARERRPTPTPEGPALVPCQNPGCIHTGPCPDSEPAAPKVVWEGSEVRVLADGRVLVLVRNHWVEEESETASVLARALAEAKREARCDHGREKDYCAAEYEAAQERASRKAAESMRERCLNLIWDRIKAGGDGGAWDAIRALPLE